MMRSTPIKRIIDPMTRTTYYKDMLTTREFKRIVGGLAWPYGNSKGHAVVLGEIRRKDPEQHCHHVFILGETRAEDFQELLSRVAMLQDRTFCKEWITPMDNNNVLLVDDFNEEQRYMLRKAPVELNSPPQYDRSEKKDIFRFYNQLVAKRASSRKTLNFGESDVAKHYSSLEKTDLKRHLEEFPVVASFLYALAELDLNNDNYRQFNMTSNAADSVAGY
ncbi:hypothetical protein [Maridesulfovibrio ferrireducens]|uniref:hypothetical protein n=1 Tax=Maridesulfovibrio ferrireducens TaxID=246191 RepID=UPI001A2BA1C1|nr:hypothetical protein [Maridesulfovibrio ferrireducens]MBI9113132.1 hypothetical protein [Maridesulfovibrio ferrireducens]